MARLTALVVGMLAVAGGIVANGQNVAFLVALAFAVAASANLPTILYSLFWRRFNTTGALCSIYGGLTTCLVLIVFSPAVSGKPTSMFKGVDFHWFPLDNPGIVAIPLSFLLGVLGTWTGAPPGRQADARPVRRDGGAAADRAPAPRSTLSRTARRLRAPARLTLRSVSPRRHGRARMRP